MHESASWQLLAAPTGREQVDNFVVGLDLRREGLLTTRLRPDDGSGRSTERPSPMAAGCSSRCGAAAQRRTPTSPALIRPRAVSSGEHRLAPPTRPPAPRRRDHAQSAHACRRSNLLQHEPRPGGRTDAEHGKICWLTKYPRSTGKRFVPAILCRFTSTAIRRPPCITTAL